MTTRFKLGVIASTMLVGTGLMAISALEARATVFSASGAGASDIQAAVDSFRAALGALNANTPTNFADGRREINWDGVPAAQSDPNPFPGNFFNGSTAGRARGILFNTEPGGSFLTSSNAGDPSPVRFGFPNDFATFSAQKLFAPVNSVITEVTFFSPANQTTQALTDGFGAVFTDVEVASITKLEYFDRFGALLASEFVPLSGNQGLSFTGVSFATPVLAKVRITSGANKLVSNGVLDNPNDDVVAMDDFIYGEPQAVADAVPAPATALLLATGLSALAWRRRRR